MITIGRIPRRLQSFFKPFRDPFTQRAEQHFWVLIMAITRSHGATIENLIKALGDSTDKTILSIFVASSVCP